MLAGVLVGVIACILFNWDRLVVNFCRVWWRDMLSIFSAPNNKDCDGNEKDVDHYVRDSEPNLSQQTSYKHRRQGLLQRLMRGATRRRNDVEIGVPE